MYAKPFHERACKCKLKYFLVITRKVYFQSQAKNVCPSGFQQELLFKAFEILDLKSEKISNEIRQCTKLKQTATYWKIILYRTVQVEIIDKTINTLTLTHSYFCFQILEIGV